MVHETTTFGGILTEMSFLGVVLSCAKKDILPERFYFHVKNLRKFVDLLGL